MSRPRPNRQARAQVLDLTIRGDELEHDRIQLEHNLQQTDLSLRLSSQDGDLDDNDSIEYPRHNSNPTSYPEFRSFINRSTDFDSDANHAWSYRTMDDDYEDALNPYGAETMSTAAHHASGLTLSAGLHGRGHRRDVSLSGAEFDPERPLRDLVGGVDSKMSIFDADPSRSRYAPPGADPLVLDDDGELSRLLESGYVPPTSLNSRSVRVQSHHSSSSASDSDSPSSRPKITDALRRVSFSPKRPRSPRAGPAQLSQAAPSPLRRGAVPPEEDNLPTPKPRNPKRSDIFASSSQQHQPEVRLHPPTPSSSSSKFTKMHRGLTKELDEEVERTRRPRKSDHSVDQSRDQSYSVQPAPRRSSLKQPIHSVGHVSKSKLYLPDVTGLTSAVESPMKGGVQHYAYNVSREARESDARLLSAISGVQTKLRQLEAENGISRRRVRELEHELELCKIEVARERSIMVQREEFLAQQQRDNDIEEARRRKGKGKARARDVSMYQEEVSRYQEVVEEKKALEALVATLRSHLKRLTEELSSHSALLTELRNLRESDHTTLKDKSVEIERLRSQVERLAGEVEVLRGVVEEGLKERRLARESSQAVKSRVEEPLPSSERPVDAEPQLVHDSSSDDEDEELDDGDEFDPISIPGSSRMNMEKTMRTDHATLGDSHMGECTSNLPGRFIDDEELEQISADIEERRSGQSESMGSLLQSLGADEITGTPSSIVENMTVLERTGDELERVEEEEDHAPVAGPSRRQGREQDASHIQPPTRPAAPTPAHATRRSRLRRPEEAEGDETPFPQIRGAHMERLFFCAPEHNAKTCNVCFRRNRHCDDVRPTSPSRFDRAHAQEGEQAKDEDEGFAEGSDDMDTHPPRIGKERAPHTASTGQATKNGTPPQTVLMKVIRELEDDFTHYKSVYVELADQYKVVDAVSDVPKRKLVARHLREVVDILEQKGDQIANLYDLLTFKDKSFHGRGTGPSRRNPVVA